MSHLYDFPDSRSLARSFLHQFTKKGPQIHPLGSNASLYRHRIWDFIYPHEKNTKVPSDLKGTGTLGQQQNVKK